MILVDSTIEQLIRDGSIVVDPLIKAVDGASVDLHLAPSLLMYKRGLLDTHEQMTEQKYVRINFSEDGYYDFNPGEFFLGATLESIKLPTNVAGLLFGRSSMARIGVSIHFAGFFDPGFNGTATLEIQNIGNNPVRLYAGQSICQMVFIKTDKDANIPYFLKPSAKYNKQVLPTESRIYKDEDL